MPSPGSIGHGLSTATSGCLSELPLIPSFMPAPAWVVSRAIARVPPSHTGSRDPIPDDETGNEKNAMKTTVISSPAGKHSLPARIIVLIVFHRLYRTFMD